MDMNCNRATRIERFIASEIKKSKCTILAVQRAYDGYCILKAKWPQITRLRRTGRLQKILDTPVRSAGEVWDGDLEALPDVDVLTVAQLKQVIRFYKIRQAEKGIVLRGNKAQLAERARTLIQRYGALLQDN